jgi:hypothetical protein
LWKYLGQCLNLFNAVFSAFSFGIIAGVRTLSVHPEPLAHFRDINIIKYLGRA